MCCSICRSSWVSYSITRAKESRTSASLLLAKRFFLLDESLQQVVAIALEGGQFALRFARRLPSFGLVTRTKVSGPHYL